MEASRLYRPADLPGLAFCHHNVAELRRCHVGKPLALPFYASRASCGFPSPADDYAEGRLDLNDLCVGNATATFFVRAEGDSMRDAGIEEGDLLVVDRSLAPASGDIVLACVEGDLTVKRYVVSRGRHLLCPANDVYPVIHMHADREWECWGVVTFTVKQQRGRHVRAAL